MTSQIDRIEALCIETRRDLRRPAQIDSGWELVVKDLAIAMEAILVALKQDAPGTPLNNQKYDRRRG